MAIFIASTKSISRSSGQSAVASASYRAGCELEDKRYGKVHDYSKKHGVMSADIILPTTLVDAKATIDRSELWNKAEDAEHRKDARVAREWLINLPYELDEQNRKELAHTFAQTLADKYGTIADCAIHQPTQKEVDRGADPRNFHAHIMFTTRTAELDADNQIILTDKATIELSDTKRLTLGLKRVSHEIKEVRQIWEQIANEKLAEFNHELIDSRSYAEQGIDIEPQLKMGAVATKLEREKYEQELRKAEKAKAKGEHYEIDKTPATELGTINEIINERNELVWSVELTKNQKVNAAADKIIFESRANNEREQNEQRFEDIKYRLDISEYEVGVGNIRINAVKRRINESKQRIEYSEQRTQGEQGGDTWSLERISDIIEHIDESKQRVEYNKQRIEYSERQLEDSQQQLAGRIGAIYTAAPSPFDDTARRTRASKLDQQQRRADQDARKHSYRDERLHQYAERIKLFLASKLLTRNDINNRIRWESYETAEDYPDKYDKRQIEKLDNFAQSLGLQKSRDYRVSNRDIASHFTADFVNQNKPIFNLIKNPAAEREHYNNVVKDFEYFKKQTDDKRTEFNASLIEKLGGKGGDVGEMTRDIVSSFSYLEALDSYIADDNRADEAKEAAKLHRADTINFTCIQFKHALFDVHKLPSNERERHSDALRTSLNSFIEQYSSELSEDQNTAIQRGINSFNHYQDGTVTRSRGLSR